jgi:predicted DNA-binding transcriptional regulator YafY
VRASRLLSVLLLLQLRGRMSAQALAEEVEASVRTIHRDIDHLSAAGVPVRAVRGREGGFELLDGWQTHLTGLTAPEARAIFLVGLPGPASVLGLGPAMASARRKLLAALPADSHHVGARFHLDPDGWFRTAAPPDHLSGVAEAVWSSRRLRIRYESWKAVVDREVEPLGLVLKAGVWYLVGAVGGDPRTFRLSSILELLALEDRFERPADFDLARYWADATRRFEEGVYRDTAAVRVTSGAFGRLRALNPAVAAAADRTAAAAEDGWIEATIPIESIDHTARELLRLGAELEVLTPAALRDEMRRTARGLAALYDADWERRSSSRREIRRVSRPTGRAART